MAKDDAREPACLSDEGREDAAADYDPLRPERPRGEADRGAGVPVSHGTPLSGEEYRRLKERARRGNGEPEEPGRRDR